MTKSIVFTLPAEALEGAYEAILLGDFNNWNPEFAAKLEAQPDGSHKTTIQLEEGKTYHYRFLLNDGRWVNDYNAQSYSYETEMNIDNCVITVPVTETTETEKPKKEKVAAKKKTTSTKTAEKAKPVKVKAAKKETSKKKSSKTEESKKVKAKSPEMISDAKIENLVKGAKKELGKGK